jgi:hypothetical protein
MVQLCGLDPFYSRQGSVTGPFECSSEHFGFMKEKEFLDKLNDY